MKYLLICLVILMNLSLTPSSWAVTGQDLQNNLNAQLTQQYYNKARAERLIDAFLNKQIAYDEKDKVIELLQAEIKKLKEVKDVETISDTNDTDNGVQSSKDNGGE